MFSKRHFEVLAEAVQALDLNRSDRQHVALMLANYAGKTNAQFNRAKFLSACKVN